MPYFKDVKNKIHFLPPGCVPVSEDEARNLTTTTKTKSEDEMERERIVYQIAEIERQITLRRLREAILTDEGRDWLANWELELQELRDELKQF